MNRKEVLKKIDEIHFMKCVGCTKRPYENTYTHARQTARHDYCLYKCADGKRLARLGKQLSKTSESKQSAILRKKKNMTFEEVAYLLRKGITKNEICKVMKITGEERKQLFEAVEREYLCK